MKNLFRDTSPQSPDVVRGHHGGSGASMYETQPHYMQALETIHRLTRERDEADDNARSHQEIARAAILETDALRAENERLVGVLRRTRAELLHLARLLEPALNNGAAQVPGLATVNAAWLALSEADAALAPYDTDAVRQVLARRVVELEAAITYAVTELEALDDETAQAQARDLRAVLAQNATPSQMTPKEQEA